MKIDLTEQDAQDWLWLADVALKHETLGGWTAFNRAGVLRQKIQDAAKAEIHATFTPPLPAVMPAAESAG